MELRGVSYFNKSYSSQWVAIEPVPESHTLVSTSGTHPHGSLLLFELQDPEGSQWFLVILQIWGDISKSFV